MAAGAALEHLLDGLFDYAGPFPPASLPLFEAVAESARMPGVLARPRLMAADLVVKAEDLAHLDDTHLQECAWPKGRPLKVVAVGITLAEAETAIETLRAFHERAQKARIERRLVGVEVASEDRLDTPEDVAARLETLLDAVRPLGATLHYEPRWDLPTWQAQTTRPFELLTGLNAGRRGADRVGVKVRCAGPTALDGTTLSLLLPHVVERGIPFKATQGLHHPIVEEDRYANPVGFLGLVLALRLAQSGVPGDQLAACMAERDPRAFTFDDEAAAWRDERVRVSDLPAFAESVPFQIGSCSLAEPDQDLVRLFGPHA